MIVAALALQLLVAQSTPSEAPLPDRPGAAEPAAAPAGEAGKASEAAHGDEGEALRPAREPSRTSLRARQTPKSALSPIPSLQSAEPLAGRSVLVGWAGWSSFGAAWGQGVTNEDDLGVLGDFDWSTGELRLSGFYRRPLGRVGAVDIGARMRAGWWADLGWGWFRDNRADRGIEVAPGLVVSTRGAGGVFALTGDLPLVVTLWHDGGIFAAPRATFSYETVLYGDLSVGVRLAGAYRAGSGDAPMSTPHGLLELEVLAGWRLF